MPFDRPLLETLRTRIAEDLTNKLPGAETRLRVNNLRVFSEVEAGAAHLLYGRLDWSFHQLFPDTAEQEFLDRWASIWGVRRVPASRATGRGWWAAQPGTSVQAGALVQLRDGVRYSAVEGASESGGRIVLSLQAEQPGAAGNADPGMALRFLTTSAGVAVEGEVEAPGLAGGADEQNDPLLLRAVLARIQMPPHGGAAFDYVRWALEVPGVTRAWPYPLQNGAGTVTVRFMMDEVRPPDGIPNAADVQLVWAHIDEVRPVTARVFVYAPIALPVPVVIADLEPDTPTIRAGIEISIRQMILDEAEPGEPIYVAQWSTAIGMAPLVRRFVLVSPNQRIEPAPGEIVTYGGISYQ